MYYAIISVEKERRKIMDYLCLQLVTWGAVLVKEKVIVKLLSFIIS